MMCKSSEKNTFVLWMCYGCVMELCYGMVLWNCVMATCEWGLHYQCVAALRLFYYTEMRLCGQFTG